MSDNKNIEILRNQHEKTMNELMQTLDGLEGEAFKKALEERMIEFAHKGQKLISFIPPLSPVSSKSLDTALQLLSTLKEKIKSFSAEVRAQSDEITKHLKVLTDEPLVQLNIDVDAAQKSVNKYLDLLGKIDAEIDKEIANTAHCRSLNQNTFLPVSFFEADDFDTFVASTVSRIKKQVKRIEKDLMVSYSRYQFSFKRHMVQIRQVQRAVAFEKKIQAIQEQKKKEKEA